MKKRMILTSVVLCLLLSVLPESSRSQSRRRGNYGARPPRVRDIERRMQQRKAENERLKQDRHRIREQYIDEANREAVGADEAQWEVIKPLLEQLKRMRIPPSITVVVYGSASGGSRSSGGSGGGSGSTGGGGSSSSGYSFSAGGAGGGVGPHQGAVKKQAAGMGMGWNWTRPSNFKAPEQMTETDKVCEGLLDLIEKGDADRAEIQKHIEGVRQARAEHEREVAKVRQQLRNAVTFEQEARLILMGYLD